MSRFNWSDTEAVRQLVADLASAMRRCDIDYCMSHDVEQVSEHEFDGALQRAEDALDDFFAPNHVAVITGTGNAKEQRQLDALCRGLRGGE